VALPSSHQVEDGLGGGRRGSAGTRTRGRVAGLATGSRLEVLGAVVQEPGHGAPSTPFDAPNGYGGGLLRVGSPAPDPHGLPTPVFRDKGFPRGADSLAPAPAVSRARKRNSASRCRPSEPRKAPSGNNRHGQRVATGSTHLTNPSARQSCANMSASPYPAMTVGWAASIPPRMP